MVKGERQVKRLLSSRVDKKTTEKERQTKNYKQLKFHWDHFGCSSVFVVDATITAASITIVYFEPQPIVTSHFHQTRDTKLAFAVCVCVAAAAGSHFGSFFLSLLFLVGVVIILFLLQREDIDRKGKTIHTTDHMDKIKRDVEKGKRMLAQQQQN